MKHEIASKISRSIDAIVTGLDLIDGRFANETSALARGTRRELSRITDGLSEIKRAVDAEASQVSAAAVGDVTPAEASSLRHMVCLLSTERLLSWDAIGESLSPPVRKGRLVQLALHAAGAPRYAVGVTLADKGNTLRVFDLLNLPREVGGASGLAAIVRACYDGSPRYALRWRFAFPSDLHLQIVTDDDDDIEG